VVVSLNFLKHSKEITLTLHPMLRFSQDEHQKMMNKIECLQKEVEVLKSKQEGEEKLTLKFNQHSVNFSLYQIVNFSTFRSCHQTKKVNLLIPCPENQLPQ
jgi:4-alpha-glucanotransferase